MSSTIFPQSRNGVARYFVGLAGCPGSGKSTLARVLCRKVNARMGSEVAVVVPMDGFHFTKKELEGMLRPEEAKRRRGAHWTFDAEAFADRLLSLKNQGNKHDADANRSDANGTILFPSFDHGVGDPEAGAIAVALHHRVVIVEGLYLLLDVPPWRTIREDVLDLRCFIQCPVGLALQRVIHRKIHVNGLAKEEATKQAHYNDKRNAILVWKTRHKADVLIPM